MSIVESIQSETADLCKLYSVERLDVFGSATSAEFDPKTSDLDFLVTFQPCTPEEHANRYFGLLFALEELFGRPVDLVEDKAISNPYFREAVEESRQLVYGA